VPPENPSDRQKKSKWYLALMPVQYTEAREGNNDFCSLEISSAASRFPNEKAFL
jgi:hypothetical protein